MSSRCSFNHKTRERVLTTHTYMSDACPTGCANIIYMLALLVFSGILIIRCCSVVVVVMSKWIFENIFVIICLKNTCDSRAPHGLPRPRGGSTPFPHNSPTICRRKNGRRWMTPRAGVSRGRVCSLPGVVDNRKYMEILVSLQLCIIINASICCCCCTLLYCCTISWVVGWCVGRLFGRWVGERGRLVGQYTWMVECVRGSGCLTCFVLLFSGPMVVSPLSLDLYYYYCIYTWFAVLL